MMRIFNQSMKKITRACYLVGSACLVAGLLMPLFPASARANSPSLESSAGGLILEEGPACVPPAGWDDTVRLFRRDRPSKTWDFEVEDPLMEVSLEFFYYQDYDRFGCPFDCSAGDCQEAEIGAGQTPLGNFEITDGSMGAHGGELRLSGRLTQGSYQASFWVTGSGSINIGLRVKKTPVVTETPQITPTATHTQEPTSTPTSTETSIVTPTATATIPTATKTPLAFPPDETATPTSPAETPTIPTHTPGARISPTPTEVSTLPPPVSPPGMAKTPVIIPVTGADLSHGNIRSGIYAQLIRNLGLGLLGLGLLLRGMGMRRSG